MKPLIFLKTKPNFDNFEASAVKKLIISSLEANNIVYSTSIISEDYNIAHFINLEDVAYFSNSNKSDIKKIITLFFSEEDIYGQLLIPSKNKDKAILDYEISKFDVRILNKLDLIIVPSNEYRNILINFGVITPINTLLLPVFPKKYDLKNNILSNAIFSYFRLDPTSKLAVTTIKYDDIEAFNKLFILIDKIPSLTFICISQFTSKNFLPSKIKRLFKNKPKNLIFTTPLTIDLYNSLMYNAKIFINLNSTYGNTLECLEAMGSKTQIFGLYESSPKDILIDKINCYLYNNIDLLRIGIDQYLLNLISDTLSNAYDFVKNLTSENIGKKLIEYYKNL